MARVLWTFVVICANVHSGELIASAGDGGLCRFKIRSSLLTNRIDGMIIIWAPTDRPSVAAYGSEHVADEDPEHWKVRISFR